MPACAPLTLAARPHLLAAAGPPRAQPARARRPRRRGRGQSRSRRPRASNGTRACPTLTTPLQLGSLRDALDRQAFKSGAPAATRDRRRLRGSLIGDPAVAPEASGGGVILGA
jgi:hypothetical protein